MPFGSLPVIALLIAPEGIEIEVIHIYKFCSFLLIAPEGIEITSICL